jgi:pyochelin synthetase
MPEAFLADLSRRGIHLWAEGDALRFRAPGRQLDAELRAEIGRRKGELLRVLQQAGVPAEQAPLRVEPDRANRHAPFPLTDIQEAYWIGRSDLVSHGSVSAHTFQEIDLPDLDLERFVAAWRRLIERHEMLRAVVLEDGRQQILAEVPPFVPQRIDLRAASAEERSVRLGAERARLSILGPAIERWPLFEVLLVQLGERHYRALVCVSLLIADALSFRTLLADLERFYADPEVRPDPLELSYRDYLLLLTAQEGSPTYARSWAYWLERLATLPPPPELPLSGRARQNDGSGLFVRRRGGLEASAWGRLRDRARRVGVTPTVVIATLYASVIATWTAQRRFTLNLLFFNRQPLHPEVEAIVGNCSSTVLLEVDFAEARSFEERARHLQDRLLQDLEHARVSGVRVLREWNRQRPHGSRLIVPVVLASTLDLGARRPPSGPSALAAELVEGCLQTPHVWLDHQVAETAEGGLAYNWDAVEELFPDGIVAEMHAAYARLLTSLADPASDWAVPLPTHVPSEHLAERARVNATSAPVPTERLEDLIAPEGRWRRAEQCPVPGDPAVLGRRRLLHGELERESAALAAKLAARGAGSGERVAIVMEKGWEQAVAALAVVRSGAAYLPIDPGLPLERRAHLCRDGGVRWALTQPRLVGALEWPPGLEVLVVGEEGGAPAPELSNSPPGEVGTCRDVAYVLYTSGSTGRPKGVTLDHRGPVNTILDLVERLGLGREDRILALSALSFDLSVFDLFGAWACGGAVVIPDPAELTEPARWTEIVRRERVTVWNSVPALLAMWVDFLEVLPAAELPTSLRWVLLSGDWIPVGLPDRLRALLPRVQVLSLGGATEASIWSILYPIEQVDPSWRSIPYGYPMLNQRFSVLDPDLEPCPRWVPGELYIGGIGVALGYWGDPERTSASFLEHPTTGERLYRTGDLGRYLPGGVIEFLGRRDFQVKVQGYRIELGEIEAALATHPSVRHAVVAALGPKQGEKRLVGYVVPTAGPLDTAELARFLAGKLPRYMVPSSFVTLEALPLSANGKLDRSLLPAPEQRGARRPAGAVPPRSELETALVAIWQEVLERSPIGITDDFFELGGYSLLAVRLMARLRARLGRDLPLASLFSASTVELQAELLNERKLGTAASALVPIQPQGDRPPLVLVHPVGGSVICYAELAQGLDTGQPVYGLELADPAWGEFGIGGLAERYRAALAAELPGPWVLGGWSMGGLIAFEMARQEALRGDSVLGLCLIDSAPPGREGRASRAESPELEVAELLAWWAADLWQIGGQAPAWTAERLLSLAREERLPAVLGSAAVAGLLPAELEAGALEHLFAAFSVNARALATYDPSHGGGRLPAVPALLVWGAQSHLAPGSEAREARGWRDHLPQIEVQVLPGDHYTLVAGAGCRRLAQAVTGFLADVPVLGSGA